MGLDSLDRSLGWKEHVLSLIMRGTEGLVTVSWRKQGGGWLSFLTQPLSLVRNAATAGFIVKTL